MAQRVGQYTLLLPSKPIVAGYAAVVGQKEGEGPLARGFDKIHDDTHVGQKNWEKAESELIKQAVAMALDKSKLSPADIHYMFAGDLLNQSIATTFGIRELSIPLLGVFSACANMAQTTMMASLFIDGGFADYTLAATCSHFCTAERQFRTPLEYGGQRTPTAQWTVTGSGALVMKAGGSGGVCVNAVTAGRIIDMGIKDANNMGAAMAPAACDTLMNYFNDTGNRPDDFDLIVTGDLGKVGSSLLYDLMRHEGVDIERNHTDCGMLMFDYETQDVDAGASGCGCAGAVLCSHLLNKLSSGEIKKMLFMATGALMSPTATQQGESIPSIAHLIEFHAPTPDM